MKKRNINKFFNRVDKLYKVMLEIANDEVREEGLIKIEDCLSFLIDCLVNLNETLVERIKKDVVDEYYDEETRPHIKGFLDQVIQIKTPEDFKKKLSSYIQ